MSWQLNTDGVDDWLSISTIELLVGDSLEFDYTPVAGNPSNQYRLAGNQEGFDNALVFRADVGLRIKASGLTTDLALPLPAVDVRTQLKIERTNGTTYQVSVDGSVIGTVNNGGKMVIDALLGINTVHTTGTSFHYKGGLHTVTFISVTPSLSRSWSADASDHSNTGSQPVLLDTIAGNNAVGVDMNTDGTDWENENSSLSLDNVSQSQSIDSVVLTENSSLSLDNVSQSQSIDSVVLTENSSLSLDSISQSQSIDSVVLTEGGSLSLDSISQSQSIDSVVLTQAHILVLDTITQSQIIENLSLNVLGVVTVDSFLQSQSLDIVTLTETGTSLLNIVKISQSQELTGVQLSQLGLLTIGDMTQQQVLDTINIGGTVIGYLRGDLSVIYAYNGKTTIN